MTDLAHLRPLVEIMAAERTKESPHLFEDAVQEGLIAAWRVSEERPEASPAYVRASARNGVLGVVRGRPMTGAPSHRGRQDAHDTAEPLTRTTADGYDYLIAEPADTRAADALSATEVRQGVRRAVEALPDPLDRAIVVGRFWHDMTFADLAHVFRRPAGTLSRRWTEIIRPALAAELAGVVA